MNLINKTVEPPKKKVKSLYETGDANIPDDCLQSISSIDPLVQTAERKLEPNRNIKVMAAAQPNSVD